MKQGIVKLIIVMLAISGTPLLPVGDLLAAEDLKAALRRSQYLLNGTRPTDADFAAGSRNRTDYSAAVRRFLEHENFYDMVLRYHEKVFGVGLPREYMEELLKEDINNKTNKFAQITCERSAGVNARFRCFWASSAETDRSGGCPESSEEAASVFWYPGVVAWVCPSLMKACGHDLSRCFITYDDEEEAANAELGTTEIFDSRYAVIRSLSRQSAGLATAIAVGNYEYTRILEPGLTAIDGAIAHFYRQPHHFKIDQLNLDPQVIEFANTMSLTNTRFQLVKSDGDNYASGGIMTTFGWLRRYDKHRTRANMLYERLLCKQFTADLPAVFPQDPGNLRTAVACMGCHAVLDPLADFFTAWGEEGELYGAGGAAVDTFFSAAGCTGNSVADLAMCVQQDTGFATCQVHHVWEWLMGRQFHEDEDTLRTRLTDYFIKTRHSFKELVFAITTHPAFTEGTRSDGVVDNPIQEPPLGQLPGEEDLVCDQDSYTYAADIEPGNNTLCITCHDGSGTTLSLATEADWLVSGNDAVSSMGVRSMPRGSPNWDDVANFRNKVRCWLENQ